MSSVPTAWSGAVLAGRRDDGPPAARGARLRERDLAAVVAVELARVVVGPDHVEREVLEHARRGRRRPAAIEQFAQPNI